MYASVHRFAICATTVLALLPAAYTVAAEAEWISLFDGKTLDGWEKVGRPDSNWEVQDGAMNGSPFAPVGCPGRGIDGSC